MYDAWLTLVVKLDQNLILAAIWVLEPVVVVTDGFTFVGEESGVVLFLGEKSGVAQGCRCHFDEGEKVVEDDHDERERSLGLRHRVLGGRLRMCKEYGKKEEGEEKRQPFFTHKNPEHRKLLVLPFDVDVQDRR